MGLAQFLRARKIEKLKRKYGSYVTVKDDSYFVTFPDEFKLLSPEYTGGLVNYMAITIDEDPSKRIVFDFENVRLFAPVGLLLSIRLTYPKRPIEFRNITDEVRARFEIGRLESILPPQDLQAVAA